MNGTAWSADVVLADGGTVHVRPIRPTDADRLVALHARLSPESRYYRFFSVKPTLTTDEVARFTNVDGVDRVALVALLGDDIVAVARYDRWAGRDEAEVAFTVDDAHHGRGLATVLLEHLAAFGRRNGLTHFSAQVLPENRPMLGVFRSAGFAIHRSFDAGVVDLEFPIGPTPALIDSIERREQRADSRSIARLLHPQAIAVFGASDRPDSLAGAVLRNLIANGFSGELRPINPKHAEVCGLPAFARLADLDGEVDLAVVAVPADQLAAIFEECASRGVRGALVLTLGDDARSGVGAAAIGAAALGVAARRNGLRVVGPGSFGIVELSGRTAMQASLADVPVLPGPVAVSVESGPLAGAVLELAHRVGLGIASFVSLGMHVDVGAADLLNHWYDDATVTVALLYTEGYGDPRRFGRVARRVSLRLPIVAVRPTLAGTDDAAAEAFERHCGVIRVGSVRQMIDVGRVLAHQPRPGGDRVVVITNSASPARLASDALRAASLAVAAVVDLGPDADDAAYRAAMMSAFVDEAVDALLIVYAPPLVSSSTVIHAIEDAASGSASGSVAAVATAAKPVVAIALGRGDAPLVVGGRVPAFAFPEPAAQALAGAVRYNRWRAAHGDAPSESAMPVNAIDHPPGDAVVDAVRAEVATRLPPSDQSISLGFDDLTALLGAAGVRVAPIERVSSIDEAVAAADRLGYPVAFKIVGLPRPGRSEAGGIALDLHDAGSLVGARRRMADLLGDAVDRAVVQSMVPPGVEVRVVIENHRAFGPTVAFGLGGLYADVIGDGPRCAAPLSTADAVELVHASRAADALARAGVATAGAEALVVAAGMLAEHVWELDRLELNPVLVSAAGVWVLDGDARLTNRPEPQGHLVRHL